MIKHTVLGLILLLSLATTMVKANDWSEENITPELSINGDCQSCPIPREPVGLLVDRYFSPYTGAEANILLMRGYELLDDAWLPSTEGDNSFGLICARFGKYLLEGILTNTQIVAQHEVFGHGFRAREFHIPVSYRITPWGGYTAFSLAQYNKLTLNQKAALSSAGMEADGILANQLASRWLNTQNIDSREAHLYLGAALDQTLYVLGTRMEKDSNPEHTSHDAVQYVNDVNLWFRNQALTTSKLRKKILIDFLNPFLYYSLFSVGDYIICGSQQWEFPMIRIGQYRYLPAFRMALAPYGPEYQFINFINTPDYPIQFIARYGNTGGKQSSGLTLKVGQLYASELLYLDGRIDLWQQPQLNKPRASLAKNKIGAAAFLTGRYKLSPLLEVMGQVGYKTSGYIPGEVLNASPIIRFGLFMSI